MTRCSCAAAALVAGIVLTPGSAAPAAGIPDVLVRGSLAWSPTRPELAFGATVAGRPGVFVARVDGSGLRRVSPLRDPNPRAIGGSGPLWSPGGNRLAFASEDATSPSCCLDLVRVINRDGTDLETIAVGDPDGWAPDAHRLLFQAFDPTLSPGAVVVADLRARTQTTIAAGSASKPVWQPHGELIAITAGTGSFVTLVRSDGSRRRQLTEGAEPVWSGDGRMLAYTLGHSVFVIRADGSGKRRVLGLPSGAFVWDKAWAPTGNRLAVLVGGGSPTPNSAWGGFVLDLTTGHVQRVLRVTPSNRTVTGPFWSPDGGRLAFVRGSRIYIVGADGAGGRFLRLTPQSASSS